MAIVSSFPLYCRSTTFSLFRKQVIRRHGSQPTAENLIIKS
jgi:hypothetical protein